MKTSTAPEGGHTRSTRVPLTVASGLTVALAAFFVVMAVLALTAGHGAFSGGVGVALIVWAVLTGAAGVWLWRGSGWARGPVVFAGLLHTFAFGQFVPTAPWAALGAAAGLLSVVCAVLPSTREALSRG